MRLTLGLLAATGLCMSLTCCAQDRAGYLDTPIIPGTGWHVHDPARPDPPVGIPMANRPGKRPARPPAGAVVLFDGKGMDQWRTLDGKKPAWLLHDGVMQVPPHDTPNGGDIVSVRQFGDCEVHVEWMLPPRVPGDEKSMNRGNSGVYLMGLFEIQVFDSYGPDYLYADGQAGAIYGQVPPAVDVCRAPGEWQCFDIVFTAPRVHDGKVMQPARVTVRHNGVIIHNNVAILGPTLHRALAAYGPNTPEQGPLMLQAHGSPVSFRNVWVKPTTGK